MFYFYNQVSIMNESGSNKHNLGINHSLLTIVIFNIQDQHSKCILFGSFPLLNKRMASV